MIFCTQHIHTIEYKMFQKKVLNTFFKHVNDCLHQFLLTIAHTRTGTNKKRKMQYSHSCKKDLV